MPGTPHVPWELEPPLRIPRSKRRRKSYRALDVVVIDKLVEAMQVCYYETKAIEYIGFSKQALMDWKRAGREYRDHCLEKRIEPDRQDPRYIDLYLLYRVTRQKFEMRSRLFTSAYMSAIGRPARYAEDPKKPGVLQLDEEGKPIKLQSEVKPNAKIALRMLAIADAEYAERSRLILTGQIPGDDSDDDKPTDFKIEVVRSRPEPERPPEQDD